MDAPRAHTGHTTPGAFPFLPGCTPMGPTPGVFPTYSGHMGPTPGAFPTHTGHMGPTPGVFPSMPGFTPMGTANGMYVYTPNPTAVTNPVPVANPTGGQVVHPQQHEVNQVLLEGLQQQQRDRLIAEIDRAFAKNSRIESVLRKQNNQDPPPP